MKKLITISIVTLLLMTGCTGNKQVEDGIITVDVTANYPRKELILQDFMDVEYVPLETNDEFICQGFVLAVGKDIIIAKNYVNDGNIFIFDRNTGKGIKKMNRKGQGGEEYTFCLSIVQDEENGEMFINDHSSRKIIVYDTDGNFKRSFKHKEGTMYDYFYTFDRENLICYDTYTSNDGETNELPFMIISKQDGSITKEIQIPFEKKIITALIKKDEVNNMTWGADPSTHYPIIPSFDHWILVDESSDTLYTYTSDHTMTPLIVRTPSIQSMNPEVFLFPNLLTDRYYFMDAVKKEFDFEKNSGFPEIGLMYDRQEKALFRYTVYNDDYSNKKQVYIKSKPLNDEIATCRSLQAPDLVESYEKGELKGRLKEIAAGLNEESNPVVMLIKHKK
jgi:hypothetical protein